MGQFKNKDFVKVIDEGSKHFGKFGIITDQFGFKAGSPELKNVIAFADNSTGTLTDRQLEKFKNLDGMIMMVPKPPITNDVWVDEQDGYVHVYTMSNVIYGKPPDNVKHTGKILHIAIPSR